MNKEFADAYIALLYASAKATAAFGACAHNPTAKNYKKFKQADAAHKRASDAFQKPYGDWLRKMGIEKGFSK